jgi:hypothetical protein
MADTDLTPEPTVVTPGTFNILAQNEIFAKVKFVAANAQGPLITIELLHVMFRPANNAIGVIQQDEWGQLQVTGEVLVDATGIFGTLTHPDKTLVSPLTSQYYNGKGIVSVQITSGLTPDGAYVDIGNVPVFEFTPTINTLAHFSSRLGVRSKDLEIITEKSAVLNMTMDEWTYRNLLLAFLGA